ncbi:MAG: hypothetical protein ACKO0Z_16880 [Betaproteobacteria bacterium]
MNRLAVILALAVAGCASVNPIPFTGPSGRQGYAMQCSGMGRTIEQCYQVAGQKCPGGYQIVSRSSELMAVPLNGSIVMAPRTGLVVECR